MGGVTTTTTDYTIWFSSLSSSKSSFPRANLGGGFYKIRELDNSSLHGFDLGIVGLLSAIMTNCSGRGPQRDELD